MSTERRFTRERVVADGHLDYFLVVGRGSIKIERFKELNVRKLKRQSFRLAFWSTGLVYGGQVVVNRGHLGHVSPAAVIKIF